MTDYSELRKTLQAHLPWHGARLSFLALFLLALIKVKTVNLSELALGFGGWALSESHYKRLQRFFRGFDLDDADIAHVVVNWRQIPQPWVLSVDRTTWEFGSRCYNILTLGIVHEGIAFPVLWWMLKKKGNSNSDERMRLLEAFVQLFPNAQIRCLCGDREFVGQSWLRYLLLEPAMPFRLRIRASDKIERDGKTLAAQVVFAHLQVGESQRLKDPCQVWGLTICASFYSIPLHFMKMTFATHSNFCPVLRASCFKRLLYVGFRWRKIYRSTRIEVLCGTILSKNILANNAMCNLQIS